jgi:hypothetical protein
MVFLFPYWALAADTVEIGFKIGDGDLSINGYVVTVTPPYVVNGLTLVPVRVITEAFGADVGWNGEAQEVTLRYDDSVIALTIGAKTALVNGEEKELLEAPQIKDDSTMVPLRFISENFGAQVGYDYETKRVTVTKEGGDDFQDGGALNVVFTRERFGDSYYGWSLKTPPDIRLESRAFDGSETALVGSYNDCDYRINVAIQTAGEKGFALEDAFEIIKSHLQGTTVVKTVFETDTSGTRFIHAQSKDQSRFYDYRLYVNNGNIYFVDTDFESSVPAPLRGDILEIPDSFKLSFGDPAFTQDLSNVNADGYRQYINDEYKLSFDLPKDWTDVSNVSETNKLSFARFENGTAKALFTLNVFSREPSLSIKDWAKIDYAFNVSMFNPEKTRASAVAPRRMGNVDGVAYTVNYEDYEDAAFLEDIYAYAGDYGYNVMYLYAKGFEQSFEHMLSSIKIERLDKNEVGSLQINGAYDFKPVKKFTFAKDAPTGASITLPKTFSQIGDGAYVDSLSGAVVGIGRYKNSALEDEPDKKTAFKDKVYALQMDPDAKISEIDDITIAGLDGVAVTIEDKTSLIYIGELYGDYYTLGIEFIIPIEYKDGVMHKAILSAVMSIG